MAQRTEIRGARILITGASGGIGQALARRFAAEGGELILSGRRENVVRALAAELGGSALIADLADAAAVRQLINAAGYLDILIANAALPGSGRLTMLGPVDIERAVAVNLIAPIMLAHAFAPAMTARGSGQLVFIGSLSARAATAGSTTYNATKFGLRGFALALRAELSRCGVGVSIVHPGFVSDAGMYADSEVGLPRWVPTVTPAQVADGVLRAIRTDRGELTVAPLLLRAGTTIASLAPDLAARGTRLLGGEQIALRFEDGQQDKR